MASFFPKFGLIFGRDKQPTENKKALESIVPRSEQGAITVENTYPSGGSAAFFIYGQGTEVSIYSQKQRIELYRKMTDNAYVDSAVDDIVNDAITYDTEKGIVTLQLDKTEFSEGIKKKIIEEFSNVLKFMQFDFNGNEIFRQWFVDGQTYAHVIVDSDNLKAGIQEIRFIDPRAIQKVVEIEKDPKTQMETGRKEYYVYMPHFAVDKTNLSQNQQTQQIDRVIQLTTDSVAYIWSGRTNMDGFPVSYMDRAIKAWNQINSIEDAFIVFHLSRAPEKRAFYIDTGDLPKAQAEKYIASMIEKYKNKAIYDTTTGKVDNAAQIQSMFHDYWIPRKNGKGTQIDVIQGTAGNGFAGPDDMKYFLEKLYRALKIPITRLNSESTTPFGKGSEITRDELKFQKLIQKLRNKFSELFSEILHKQLLLKNIITQEDWEENSYNIRYDFSQDSMFFEMKFTEILEMRLNTLGTIAPYIGEYFTHDWVKKNILQMTEEEIDDMDKKMEEEKAAGLHDTAIGQGGTGDDDDDSTDPTDPKNIGDYGAPKNKRDPQKNLTSKSDTEAKPDVSIGMTIKKNDKG